MCAGTTAILLNTRRVSLATENLSWWECLGCDSLASDQVKGALHWRMLFCTELGVLRSFWYHQQHRKPQIYHEGLNSVSWSGIEVFNHEEIFHIEAVIWFLGLVKLFLQSVLFALLKWCATKSQISSLNAFQMRIKVLIEGPFIRNYSTYLWYWVREQNKM